MGNLIKDNLERIIEDYCKERKWSTCTLDTLLARAKAAEKERDELKAERDALKVRAEEAEFKRDKWSSFVALALFNMEILKNECDELKAHAKVLETALQTESSCSLCKCYTRRLDVAPCESCMEQNNFEFDYERFTKEATDDEAV